MTCQHLDFVAVVDVQRLTGEEGGDMVGLVLEVSAKCLGCGSPVVFHAPTVGMLPGTPTRDPIGQKLTAPARLAVHPEDFGLQLPGFTVTAHAPPGRN